MLSSEDYILKWTSCSDVPSRLYNVSSAVDGSILYITAGDSPNPNCHNKVFSYDTITDKWGVLSLPGHYLGTLCMVGQNLSIFGGLDLAERKYLKRVSTYHTRDNKWSKCYPDMIHFRYKSGVVTYREYVIVLGGESSSHRYLHSIEVLNWQLHPQSQWREVATHLPVPMWAVTPTISDNDLLIVGYNHAGGCSKGSYQIPIASVTTSRLVASDWKELPPAPYWKTATVPYSNPPLIIGGESYDNQRSAATADICAYDKSKNSWTKVCSLKSARSCVGIQTISSHAIIVIGGTKVGSDAEEAEASSLSIVEMGHLVPKH